MVYTNHWQAAKQRVITETGRKRSYLTSSIALKIDRRVMYYCVCVCVCHIGVFKGLEL